MSFQTEFNYGSHAKLNKKLGQIGKNENRRKICITPKKDDKTTKCNQVKWLHWHTNDRTERKKKESALS